MKGGKFKLYGMIVILLLVLYSHNTQATIDVNRLATSTYRVQNHEYPANENNDIFVKPHQELGLITEESRIRNSDANLRQFRQQNLLNFGARTDTQTHSLPFPGVLGYTNTTNSPMMLEYEAEYYDLLNTTSIDGNDNSTSFQSLLLYTGRVYGFRVEVEEIGPMFLSFFLDELAVGTVLTMTIQMLSPSGIQNTFFQGMTRKTMTYVPFMTYETGNYTFFVSPNRDGVFTEISVNDNPNIEEISTGVSKHLRSGESVITFYRIPVPGEIPSLVDVRNFIFQSRHLGGLAYLGTPSMRIFPSSPQITSQFGTTLPMQVVSSDHVIVSVVVVPPDESDPSIQAEKDNANLPDGIDIEYSITSQFYSIPQLPINEDFVANSQNPATTALGQQIYVINVTETLFLGLNSSSAFSNSATFIPLGMNGTTTTMDADFNDILNNPVHSPGILFPGEYYVLCSQNIGLRVSSFDIADLERVDAGSMDGVKFSTMLNQPEFYFLNGETFHLDYLNITYLDQANHSISLEFSFYRPDGTVVFSTVQNFEHYYDIFSTLQVTNNTAIIPPIFNVGGLYLRINQVGNTIYNDSGTILATDDKTLTSNFRISPMSQSEVTKVTNPNAVIDEGELTDGKSLDLKAVNRTIQGLYSFQTEADHAYHLTVDSINRTLNSVVLTTKGGISWDNSFIFTPKTIDNQTHYIYEFDFASSDSRMFGLFIALGSQFLNGTLSVTLEEVEVHHIPELILTIMNDQGFSETRLGTINKPGITIAVSLGLIGIAVAVILLRQKAMV